MQTLVRELRGIPYFLLKEYLQEMGGVLAGENIVRGNGWAVTLERMEPYRVGSLEVGQTRLTMELDELVAKGFLQRFDMKILRAGA
ncbi:MAG: DUF1952 domain-containing protein [Chloroflexi bacterium]|nr:DUF1952 domain-containing protein [Chloroflexota bacterium]